MDVLQLAKQLKAPAVVILVLLTKFKSEAASTVRMCNKDLGLGPCPKEMFCDKKVSLCAPCDAEVCNKEIDNWEKTCQRHCPEHYADLLSTTQTTEGSTEPFPANAYAGRFTEAHAQLFGGIGLAVVLIGAAIVVVVFAKRRCRHRHHEGTRAGPETGAGNEDFTPGLSARKYPVTEPTDTQHSEGENRFQENILLERQNSNFSDGNVGNLEANDRLLATQL